MGNYMALLDTDDGGAIHNIAGIVRATVVAACIWSAGVAVVVASFMKPGILTNTYKPLLMVNHNLQLHVECFKFERVIISYKWTNGLLNVYTNDSNSTIN
jgi:hypothetical protein